METTNTGPSSPDIDRSIQKQSKEKKTFASVKRKVIDKDLHVTIFRLATSPNWYVQFNDKKRGQRKRSLKTRNVKEATRRAWDIVKNLRDGETPYEARKVPTIMEAIEKFLYDKERVGRRGSTIGTYRGQLIQFGQYMLERGIKRIDQVEADHVDEYEERLKKSGVAVPKKSRRGRPAKENKQSTVHEKVKLVKSLCKWASNRKMIRDNPLSGYQLPHEGEATNYCYRPEEVEGICTNADPFFAKAFRFLALTGMREGELIWLTKEDVNLARRTVSIRPKTIDKLGWKPKTDSREVPLSAPALEIAKEMLASSPESKRLFPAPTAHGVRDDRLRAQRLCAHLKRAKLAAGVESGTVHSFRHFFVSTMANAGVSPFQVMKIVGHKSLDIILRYYHVSLKELLDAIDSVDFTSLFTPRKESEQK